MVRGHEVTRRAVVKGAFAGAAGLAAAGGIAGMVSARKAPAVIQGGGTFTYWGGLIFSDAANSLLQSTIEEWCRTNGLEPDVVMINQNETVQRVSAAVEAGTMPDCLDLGLDLALQLASSQQIIAVDDLYETIGAAHGGWFESVANATAPERFGGSRVGIPFGASGNILFRRTDVLSEAGLTTAPTTWQEVADQARAAQQPPTIFGLGFSLANVGDGNVMISIMQSYGGRIADDAGKVVMVSSEATRAFLEWVQAVATDGIFSPGNTTWDGAGDNAAYQAGQAVFILNTGSVHINLLDADPELDAATGYSPLPSGPVGLVSPLNPNIRSIPTSSANPDAARALLEYLAMPAFSEQYYNSAIYGPVLQGEKDFAIFSTEVHGALKGLVENGTAPAAPDTFNGAYAETSTTFAIPRMIQRMVVDGMSIDDTMAQAQSDIEAIYAKYP